MFKKTFICLVLSGCALSESQTNWQVVPLYSAEYQPQLINEGLQMTHAMSFARSDPNIVYLCTDTSRVWKSPDRGQTWQHRSDGMISNGCRSIGVDPVDPNRVIAAGFLGVFPDKAKSRKFQHQGIYLSINGGTTWSLVKDAPFYRQVSKAPLIAADSSTSDRNKTSTWYAGGYDGLYISKDAGATWSKIPSGLSQICAVEEASDQPGHFFIATDSQLYFYDKTQFIPIGRGLPKNTCSIASHPAHPGLLLAANEKKGIFRSKDGGISFEPSNSGLPLFKANITSIAIGSAPPYPAFAKSHQSPFRLPFYSLDEGKTWQQGAFSTTSQATGKADHFWFSSVFAPDPADGNRALVVSSGDGKVFETIDSGKTWQLFGTGYTGARVMDMAFTKDSIILALTDFGLWKKQRNENFFHAIDTPHFNKQTSAGLVTALANGRAVFTVGDWGNQCIASVDPNGHTRLLPRIHGRFRHLHQDPANDQIIYIDNFRSIDGGNSWKKLSRKVVGVSRNPAGRLYALDNDKGPGKTTTIVYSDNKGDTWTPAAKPLAIEARSINTLVEDPFNSRRLYLGTSGGIRIYDGDDWIQPENGPGADAFGLTYISALAADTLQPGNLYAGRAAPGRGASNGIYQSTDSGLTWTNITKDFSESMVVWSLHFDPYESTVYAGTDIGLIRLKNGPSK